MEADQSFSWLIFDLSHGMTSLVIIQKVHTHQPCRSSGGTQHSDRIVGGRHYGGVMSLELFLLFDVAVSLFTTCDGDELYGWAGQRWGGGLDVDGLLVCWFVVLVCLLVGSSLDCCLQQ